VVAAAVLLPRKDLDTLLRGVAGECSPAGRRDRQHGAHGDERERAPLGEAHSERDTLVDPDELQRESKGARPARSTPLRTFRSAASLRPPCQKKRGESGENQGLVQLGRMHADRRGRKAFGETRHPTGRSVGRP
jgi:hypothetical protein